MRLIYLSSGPRHRVFDALLAAGHEIEAVFVTDLQRWPKVVPTAEHARARNIAVREISKADLPGLAGDVAGRVCLSVGFAYILPSAFIRSAKVCLNVHGTMLPHYAGARTLNWVIARGETESGVTVHVIDEGVDTGPILLQRSFPLSRFETGRSLYRKTLEFEPDVVVEALAIYERIGLANVRPQNYANVERHPDRVPMHSRLDPNRTLAELYNDIRAADPEVYPAYFEVDGQKVCVRLWRQSKPDDESDLI